ncbi:MAG: sigma-70 family RNA polymerase sigma factor, partial [Alcanivoracaceae bacterium]|nr:sigma-70 family RNA polymerase sigma factor [Alcanivoracaceae bacterium]
MSAHKSSSVTPMIDNFKNISDKQLIRLFIQGDEPAQKHFIDKYRKWVIGVAIKQFRLDVFNAEEIFQIILLNLIEKDYHVLKTWQGKGKFSTFLTVIVTRACIKYVNKDKKHQSLDDVITTNFQDSAPEPDELIDSINKLEIIQSRFLQLSERDQLLLSYRLIDELQPIEIAKILNMKAATVRKAIHDALLRLKNKLPFDVT